MTHQRPERTPAPNPSSVAPAPSRRLLTASGKVLASRVVLYAGTLLTVVITARELGAAGRGAITLVLTITSLGGIIFTIGLPVAGRLLLVADDPVSTGAYLGLALATTLLLAIVAPFVAVGLLPVVGVHLSSVAFVALSGLAAFNAFANAATPALAAFGRVEAGSAWIAAGYVSQALLCALAVAIGDPDVAAFVTVLAAGMAVPSVGAVWHLRRLGKSVRPVFDRRGWARLIRTGVPSVSTVFSETATFRIDRLILGALRSPAAVGIYSVGSTAAEMFRFIPWSINQLVFYEVVVGRISRQRLRFLRLATIGGLAIVAVIGALIAPYLIDALLGRAFEGSVEPFRILLLAELGLAWYLFDSTLLLSSHQVKRAATAAGFGVVMILIADFVLIDAYGVTGAAIASVVTYWAMAAIARQMLRRARLAGQLRLASADAELEAEIEAGAPPITDS